MKHKNVGGSVKGDDLGLKFITKGGLDGEEATHSYVLGVVDPIHGCHRRFLVLGKS